MDLVLPVLDGWTATRELKTDARTSHIPVFALSARLGEAEQNSAIAAGCDGFISKPFHIQAFLEQIARRVGYAI